MIYHIHSLTLTDRYVFSAYFTIYFSFSPSTLMFQPEAVTNALENQVHIFIFIIIQHPSCMFFNQIISASSMIQYKIAKFWSLNTCDPKTTLICWMVTGCQCMYFLCLFWCELMAQAHNKWCINASFSHLKPHKILLAILNDHRLCTNINQNQQHEKIIKNCCQTHGIVDALAV